jgi:hypothetical protein
VIVQKLFSVFASGFTAKQSPRFDVNCDPSTPLGVTDDGFYTVSIPLREEGWASVFLVPMFFIGSGLGEAPKGSHSDNLII